MNWPLIISGVIQLVFLILNNWSTKEKEQKEADEELRKELQEALRTNDNARLTILLERIRLRQR